ncbi:MAG: anti-sigma regulatory factor [Variovorax sp.]|nr:anti-sigma regulatory factor [Variovorax sp.]
MTLTELSVAGRLGMRLDFRDRGKGIANIELALQDGFTTANSLGLGLGGARRLVNEFAITSVVGEGTHVQLTQWKRR